jgi:glutamine amidotransferase/cyclase/glutamine amidotransferase
MNSLKIGILDYQAGNLHSVLHAFKNIGIQAELIQNPAQFKNIDLLVFPGQGSFGDSIHRLTENQLWDPLQQWLQAQKPYLGICLGYQLLFESSEECPNLQGLNLFKGQVVKFKPSPSLTKIPHMGWNQVSWSNHAPAALQNLPNHKDFYFVHSYYPQVNDPSLALCTTDYEGEFTSGIYNDHIVAVQYHPEKSQKMGALFLTQSLAYLSRS